MGTVFALMARHEITVLVPANALLTLAGAAALDKGLLLGFLPVFPFAFLLASPFDAVDTWLGCAATFAPLQSASAAPNLPIVPPEANEVIALAFCAAACRHPLIPRSVAVVYVPMSCKAANPCTFVAVASAPAASSSLMIFKFPLHVACMSGVSPWQLTAFGSAPPDRRAMTPFLWFETTA